VNQPDLIAITGGTGFVGQAMIDCAEGKGITLRSLARRVPADRRSVEWVGGHLADRAALAKLVNGADAMIHVAGQVRARDPREFDAANVTGTLNVIDAARDAGVRRFVFVSSLAAREPKLSRYGASKRRAEKLVAASGLDWTIVRPPAVYGPRDGEMLDLFQMASRGIMPMPRQGRASLIHVDDLARLLLALAASDEQTSGQIYEPDDGKPAGWEHGELARAIGWAVGKRPLVPRLPDSVLGLAAKLDGLVRRDNAKLTPDRVGYMCHPDWVSTPAAKPSESLWKPEIVTREGLKATAQWYRDQAWLG
jgi:nucleoside-diphosphate-sugar epimerase